MSDCSAPNEKYFEHADWFIRKAAEYDQVVLLAPAYLGYPSTDEGFIDEVMANGAEKLLQYGQFLGLRYEDFDNIIWVMSGDRDPGPHEKTSTRLHSASGNTTSAAFLRRIAIQIPLPQSNIRVLGWISVPYAYQIVHLRLIEDYNRTPAMPSFLIESIYEGEHNSSEVQIRRQAYWAVLCGSFGHVMGNRPIWLFGPGWQKAMDAPGSAGMMHWGRLFRSRRGFDLVPDQEHRVVTDGLGEFWGLDYLAAARTSDGSTAMAYMPTARTMTVDMAKLSASPVNAWWLDPRTGKATSAGSFPAAGSRQFTPPAQGDWVLVLDDAFNASVCAWAVAYSLRELSLPRIISRCTRHRPSSMCR